MIFSKGNNYYIARHEDAENPHHVATVRYNDQKQVTEISYHGIFQSFFGKEHTCVWAFNLYNRKTDELMLQNAWVIAGSINFQRELMEIDDVP